MSKSKVSIWMDLRPYFFRETHEKICDFPRLRETSVDPMWPRRKKSDLMSHLVPASRPQRRPTAAAEVPKEPTQAPVKIPIQKKSSGQDSMWPRRRKSDLLIYQQTRCLN